MHHALFARNIKLLIFTHLFSRNKQLLIITHLFSRNKKLLSPHLFARKENLLIITHLFHMLLHDTVHSEGSEHSSRPHQSQHYRLCNWRNEAEGSSVHVIPEPNKEKGDN